MSLYGALTTATLGMMSQSYALNTIGVNIANVTTGGYKSTETRFQTVLSRDIFQQMDNGGVRPKDVQNIARQGLLSTTGNDLDLAINGDGFFILSPTLTVGDELFYGRDGTFTVKIENEVTETDTTGQTSAVSSTREGYLVDKNGYYLLGWVPDADGTFSNSGTLQALRVDPDYFAETFEATTNATLGLNLPANNVDVIGKQVNTVTLDGTIEAGDVYSITINTNTTVSYTTTGGEASIDDVRDALIALVNAAGQPVQASSGGTGKIALVSTTAGTAFTASGNVADGGGTDDGINSVVTTTANLNHASAVALANAGNPPDGFETYSVTVVDSNGVRQTVRLNLSKTSTNNWEVSATTQGDKTAQVDTITFTGGVDPGDKYFATVAGKTVSYTATATDTTLAHVRNGLLNAIQLDTTISAAVTAAASGTDKITLTAKTAGTSFTASASATNGGANVAQVDTLTIGGSVEAGDTYSVTVNGFTVTYTVTGLEADLNAIRSAFRAQINADLNVGPLVTAADGGAGVITLTADTAGTPFTATAGFTDNGGTVDNSAAIATTTANYALTNTANATLATTTANDVGLVTTAAQALVFNGTGQLTTPAAGTPITFAMTFADGGTATVAFDIDSFTQFASGFLPQSYDSNGFEKSNLSRLQFDQAGHVVGSFGGLNNRNLYKIPVAIFINPNGLEHKTGNVFAETIQSGSASIFAADQTGQADFVPATRELSNVDIADEFTRMIQTQAAYNANATAFRTADEMTVVARDLKA